MAKVIFYGKPGCINNTKQKKLLEESGHLLEERDILQHPWTAAELRPFFARLPAVAYWFNPAAPRIRSGEVVPATLHAETAIALMLEDHYLIRRPLLQVGIERRAGFDHGEIDAWIGLRREDPPEDLQTCPVSMSAEADRGCRVSTGGGQGAD